VTSVLVLACYAPLLSYGLTDVDTGHEAENIFDKLRISLFDILGGKHRDRTADLLRRRFDPGRGHDDFWGGPRCV